MKAKAECYTHQRIILLFRVVILFCLQGAATNISTWQAVEKKKKNNDMTLPTDIYMSFMIMFVNCISILLVHPKGSQGTPWPSLVRSSPSSPVPSSRPAPWKTSDCRGVAAQKLKQTMNMCVLPSRHVFIHITHKLNKQTNYINIKGYKRYTHTKTI